MKIVVLDGYTENPGDLSWEGFENLGAFVCYDRTPLDDDAVIAERIGDAEVAITNKTPISRAVIEKCQKLKYIGILATGYDVIDIDAARARGVVVTNIPTYGTYAVGQMAIALLLEICHRVQVHSDSVHNGDWENCEDFSYWLYPLIELADKTMGIIGYGRIGQVTGKIAQAMGMKVLAFDEYQNKSLECETMRYTDLDTLLRGSDVIALHCPLLPSTEGMINKSTIKKMKDGVIVLNNSRGPLVVEQDLADALNSGKIYAAGLDVVSTEPINGNSPLLTAKNCLITPHISWAPKESRKRLMDIAVENLEKFMEGNPVNVVNP